MDLVEAPELADRLGVVVHAQVDDAVDALAAAPSAAPDALDDDGGGLLPARVAALLLPRLERGDQAVRERHPGCVDERGLHRGDDVLGGEDVPLDRVARPGAVAGPGETLGTGVGRSLAGGA